MGVAFEIFLRRFCFFVIASLVLFSPLSIGGERLNVVFILADDLGYGDLGCFGQTKIRTPNLDRMAAEGMRLTAHYAGHNVCAPSRCALLSGKHPGHGYIRENRGGLGTGVKTIGSVSSKSGANSSTDSFAIWATREKLM